MSLCINIKDENNNIVTYDAIDLLNRFKAIEIIKKAYKKENFKLLKWNIIDDVYNYYIVFNENEKFAIAEKEYNLLKEVFEN